MLTSKELEDLLVLNEKLSIRAIRVKDFRRILDLTVHRSIVKDMLIESLKEELLKATQSRAA